ncbi:CotH kinase family protein [Maribacter sp. HTCC2170]|uniref:CotH kinase family protein n=1 Tax=Maribacter sp. (strain HTCC2170 / KCCM 42371) TaxID=313603 RepID=UPI00130530F2|nr:CotH kinase family protein [Maribacter sp. HTCC2170]
MNYKFQMFKIQYRLLLVLFTTLIVGCSNDDGNISVDPDKETEIPDGDRLPSVSINTLGGSIVDEPKIDALMTITEDGTITFDGNIAIEIRGSSSQFFFPKKSYGFETRDASNEDLDVALMGFPEEEDWILHGPFSDKSLVRNKLIFDLARDFGMYASRTKFTDVSINDDYQGVYVLMEKIKRDSVRLDISKLKIDDNLGEELTGGYILKIDKSTGAGSGLSSMNSFISPHAPLSGNSGQTIVYQYAYPKPDEITSEQRAYITDYVLGFENALAADTFTDPTLGYSSYIDVASFIDFFILNELSNNVDGYRLSTYLHKDKNEKLRMGPIWDFNLAFGNADYCSGGSTQVWAYRFNERCPGDFWQVPFWWDRLLQDPEFVSQLKARWTALRSGILADGNIHNKVDSYVANLETTNAIESNFQKWNIFGTYVWPNNYVGASYSDEVDYLRTWIDNRLWWLDGSIEAL